MQTTAKQCYNEAFNKKIKTYDIAEEDTKRILKQAMSDTEVPKFTRICKYKITIDKIEKIANFIDEAKEKGLIKQAIVGDIGALMKTLMWPGALALGAGGVFGVYNILRKRKKEREQLLYNQIIENRVSKMKKQVRGMEGLVEQ